jgi:transposase-like protein
MAKGVPNRKYTPEFKTLVIETMHAEGLNYSEAGRRFGIKAHTLLQIWDRIYLAEGPEGFAIERRGHSTSACPLKRVTPDKEKELLSEVQRLRAENAYLKKLQALVLEDERRQRKKRRRSKI